MSTPVITIPKMLSYVKMSSPNISVYIYIYIYIYVKMSTYTKMRIKFLLGGLEPNNFMTDDYVTNVCLNDCTLYER